MANIETGWEHDKRTHFDDIVANYDAIRPEYPEQLFADIFAYSGAAENALEIGAGTGKATRHILDAGCSVTAVEPGENMAEFLRERFADRKNFDVIVATFEDAEVNGNYDLIYAATSFHWVNAEIGLPKAWRLLRPGGMIALFRYNGVPSDGEPLYEEIQSVYEKYYNSHYGFSGRPPKDEYGQPSQLQRRFGFSDLAAYGFGDVTMKLYDTEIIYTADEYIALLDTLSDHRHLPEANRTALYAGIKEAIIKYGGRATRPHTFQLYMGRKRDIT